MITRTRIVALLIVVPLFAAAWWMLVDRTLPYERISGVIRPQNPMPGATIEAEWNIRTARACDRASGTNLTRQIVDSHKVIWDFESTQSIFSSEAELGMSSPNRIVRVFSLPLSIAPGPAIYRSKACFACNPLQHLWPICVDKPDIEFTIGPPAVRQGPR